MCQAAFFLYIWPVKRILLTSLLSCLFLIPGQSQAAMLGDHLNMQLAGECIRFTYGHEFTRARTLLKEIAADNPGHPAPPFLEALILYWEYFPLHPDMPQSDTFVALMDLSIDRAVPMLEHPEMQVEGTFFDLFGRAFKAMYWADNERTAKAAGDLRIMYKRTKEGFDLVDDFSDFLFSTGLYNYYIEAYPEVHPIYKPLVAFMHDGDRELGLDLLYRAMDECVYLGVESRLFMTLILLNYEDDLDQAALIGGGLLEDFPRNMYYQGLALTIWLHQGDLIKIRGLLEATSRQGDRFSLLVRELAIAFLAERKGQEVDARLGYYHCLERAEDIGPMADTFMAMAYMGLSRLSDLDGDDASARKYRRKAKSFTPYQFILEASW